MNNFKVNKMIRLYKISLEISFSITITGAMFKIMHWPGASLLLSIGMFVSLIYIVIALVEIYKTDKSLIEKILWSFGFVVFSWLVGLIYYSKELKPKYLK